MHMSIDSKVKWTSELSKFHCTCIIHLEMDTLVLLLIEKRRGAKVTIASTAFQQVYNGVIQESCIVRILLVSNDYLET